MKNYSFEEIIEQIKTKRPYPIPIYIKEPPHRRLKNFIDIFF
jgi:hypothetical protein